jgi:hypothetical protein
MLSLLNLLVFLALAGYATYLFAQLVYSRYLFVKLGKKADFERNLKERINAVLVNGFGQRKLFKDKKSAEIGLVSKVVPMEELWQAVKNKAEKILAKGPFAVRMAKMVIDRGLDADMDTALLLEKMAQALLFGSQDKNEGTQAFLEKRQASFSGK